MQKEENEKLEDSFEQILPDAPDEEDFEIITGLREKIVKINSLSIEKSNVFFLSFLL